MSNPKYLVIAEKQLRVSKPQWHNVDCAFAYKTMLQSMWPNEQFKVVKMTQKPHNQRAVLS